MIPRYSRPEMASIWAPETRFRIWFEIEAHAAAAMAEIGVIPQGRRQGHLGQGQQGHVRHRPHRRDRAGDQARRHRLPDASRRARRPRSALRAPGHDLLRRARHLPQRAAHARRRPPDRRPRPAARRAEAARARAQADADHRPQPRHPRRADHVRAEARLRLRRVRARQGAHDRGAQGDRDLRDLGRGRHLRQHRPARRSLRRQEDGPRASSRSRRR